MTMTATADTSEFSETKKPRQQQASKRKVNSDLQGNEETKRHHHHQHHHHRHDQLGDHQKIIKDKQDGNINIINDKNNSPSSASRLLYLEDPFQPSSTTSTTKTTTKTSSKTNTPKLSSPSSSWVPSKEIFPGKSATTTAIYGYCTHVSNRYTKICRIGEGTYGVVYLAQDKVTKEQVALKRCLPHHEASDGFPITTLREITILKELASAGGERNGIISLRDVTVSTGRSGVFLVFEYAQHDLASLIDNHYSQHKCSPFTHAEVKCLMFQLLEALRFLHSNYVLHRDLKLSNLLYNHRGELKVADFGLARRVGGKYVGAGNGDSRTGHKIGTIPMSLKNSDDSSHSPSCYLTPKVVSLWYRPPELLLGAEHYDQAVDIWSSGCVMGELLRGKPIMDGKNELDQLHKMFEFLGPPNSDDWPGLTELPLLRSGEIEIPKQWRLGKHTDRHLLDIFRNWRDPPGMKLLMGLLQYNPALRLKAKEALSSEYFSSLPKPTPLRLMPRFPTKHNME